MINGFEYTPLFTPEAVKSRPLEVLSSRPMWLTMFSVLEEPEPIIIENTNEDLSLSVVIVVGGKHKKTQTLTTLQLAYLYEATRFGHTLKTNTNASGPHPKIYTKFTFLDAPNDSMPVARVFVDAGPNEAVTTLDIASDLRPWNLIKHGAGKPTKFAKQTLDRHVRRLLKEREAEGTLPNGFNPQAYLDNFEALRTAIELETHSVMAS